MSPPLRWEGGWCINAHGERVYAFHVRRDAGRITRMNPKPGRAYGNTFVPARASSAITDCAQIDLSRSRRARRTVVDLAVASRLHRAVTLTYQDLPETGLIANDLRLYLRRLRRRFAEVAWIAAGQRGSESGRPHIHLLLPKTVDIETAKEQWLKGIVHVTTTRTIDGLRRAAMYMCHDFDLSAEDRLTKHRYSRSRNCVLDPPQVWLLTEQEMDEWILDQGIDVQWRTPDDQYSFVQRTGFFDPHNL